MRLLLQVGQWVGLQQLPPSDAVHPKIFHKARTAGVPVPGCVEAIHGGT